MRPIARTAAILAAVALLPFPAGAGPLATLASGLDDAVLHWGRDGYVNTCPGTLVGFVDATAEPPSVIITWQGSTPPRPSLLYGVLVFCPPTPQTYMASSGERAADGGYRWQENDPCRNLSIELGSADASASLRIARLDPCAARAQWLNATVAVVPGT